MTSKDIANWVSQLSGKPFSMNQAAGVLSKISDPQKCDLGNFVQKQRHGKSFEYALIPEACHLNEQQAYELTLRRGKNRYTLQDALKDFPELQQYHDLQISHNQSSTVSSPHVRPKFAVQSWLMPLSIHKNNKKMDFAIRYSDKYALSFSMSIWSVMIICAIILITVGICAFLFYILIAKLIIFFLIAGIGYLAAILFRGNNADQMTRMKSNSHRKN